MEDSSAQVEVKSPMYGLTAIFPHNYNGVLDIYNGVYDFLTSPGIPRTDPGILYFLLCPELSMQPGT